MKFVSTGLPAASRSRSTDDERKRGGFTLLEALVALALILAFASALGPYLFQARQIMANAEHRVAAQVLLRTLLDAPFNRSQLSNVSREGEAAGLHWHLAAEPVAVDTGPSRERRAWTAVRIVASVSSDGGQVITAETVRLAKSE
jgi:prepilin-type N-terminal cleavage/methylation domain-containing protein